MEDRQSIPQIINAFRNILEDIFQVSIRDDYINKIFSNDYKDEVNKKIDHYFENEINELYTPKELYTMKDGVQYLLEKIRNSNRVMKILFYLTLFHKDEIILENEISDLLDRIL